MTPRVGRRTPRIPTATAAAVRLLAGAGLLGLVGGCALFLGISNLADPGNVADMTARFKAIVQAELPPQAPLDWGPGNRNIWFHYMGPGSVAYCGRPANAAPSQPTYHVNFYRGSFGNIGEIKVETPAHPNEEARLGMCSSPPPAPADEPP